MPCLWMKLTPSMIWSMYFITSLSVSSKSSSIIRSNSSPPEILETPRRLVPLKTKSESKTKAHTNYILTPKQAFSKTVISLYLLCSLLKAFANLQKTNYIIRKHYFSVVSRCCTGRKQTTTRFCLKAEAAGHCVQSSDNKLM